MNLAHFVFAITNRFVKLLLLLKFQLFQKPLWKISYSSKGNKFRCKGILLNCSIDLVGNNNEIIIEKGVVLNNTKIEIRGHNHLLVIGENTKFTEKGRIRILDENNHIIIGKNSILVGVFLSSADNNSMIEVGDDCLMSNEVIIRSSDSHSVLNSKGDRINKGKDVIIGNHVWIGYGVTILKGSDIGDDCIIGTESVVTGIKIPIRSLAVGIPAKILKSEVTWNQNRI